MCAKPLLPSNSTHRIVDLQPTSENISNTYLEEAIGRNRDAFRYLSQYLILVLARPCAAASVEPLAVGSI